MTELGTQAAADTTEVETASNKRRFIPSHRLLSYLSFRSIGALYVWALIVVVFGVWIPDLFFTSSALGQIANGYSIDAIAALALVLPLSAGVYDLSVGSIMGLSGVVAGALLRDTHLPVGLVVLIAVATGLAAGGLNALIVFIGIDSFIGTLATGSVIAAVTLGASGQQILTSRMTGGFTSWASTSVWVIQLPFFYVLIIAVILAVVLTRTVLGRRAYASGFNPVASRLAGVSVDRIRTFSLLASGVLAAFAGVALAARVQAADPSVGPTYLIPAFSAAFLGATQFRSGRFNPWGTLVAVFMIGTGSVGLLLAGAPQWSPQLFQGVVLIIAVGITVVSRRGRNE
jgi:ribose transport system permease protein